MLVGSPETPPEYSEARLVITTRHDRATIDHFPRRNASYNPEQDLDRRNPGNHGVGMKKLIWSAVMLLAACTLVCHAETEPAFSCAKARTTVERTICSDDDLAQLDRRLARGFEYALQKDPGLWRKTQRSWLKERDSCDEDVACIKAAYERRLGVIATHAGHPDSKQAEKLCQKFLEPRNRTPLFVERGEPVDINNDGVPEMPEACFGGTMNTPCMDYVDSRGNKLEIESDIDWMEYWNFGEVPFRYEGKTYINASFDDDLAEPAHISYVTPYNHKGLICDFANEVDSVLVEGSAKVCNAIAANDPAIEPVQLRKTNPPDYSIDRRETTSPARGPVDIDNDGKAEDLMELEYASGAGRGCDYNYFDLAFAAAGVRDNDKSSLLLQLQNVRGDGRPQPCYGQIINQLFRFEGKTYFETNLSDQLSVQHTIRLIDGGAVVQVCAFERRIRSNILSIQK